MVDTDESIFNTESELTYGVYAGSLSDLSILDLSFLNLRFAKINSPELKEFFESTTHESYPNSNASFIERFQKDFFNEDLYVLYPIDLTNRPSHKLLVEIESLFLIMYPSDFRLYSEVYCRLHDNKFLHANAYDHWEFESTGIYISDNYMCLNEDRVAEINEFIKLYFKRKDSIDYLNITISSYINAFFQDHIPMAYVSLCISLESLIDGKSELIYRIKRNSAILNSDTKEDAWLVFKNVGEFYDLRSTIVHGDKFKLNHIENYFPLLRSLVSRTIIELITLNIQSREALNRKLTEVGFGNKNLLVSDYKKFHLDTKSLFHVKVPLK